jgi:hypothetical protein
MHRPIFLLLLVSAALLGAAHCGGAVAPVGPSGDGGTGADSPAADAPTGSSSALPGPVDAAPGPTPTEAGVGCAALPLVGSPVPTTMIAEAAPQPQGGTIVPGTYVLTQLLVYTGPNGASGTQGPGVRISVDLGAASIDVTVQAAPNQQPTVESLDYYPSGSNLVLNEICPGSQSSVVPYSATDSTFVAIGQQSGGGTALEVFTRQ